MWVIMLAPNRLTVHPLKYPALPVPKRLLHTTPGTDMSTAEYLAFFTLNGCVRPTLWSQPKSHSLTKNPKTKANTLY